MGALTPAVDRYSDEPGTVPESAPSANGALEPAELRVAAKLIAHAEANGAHPNGAASRENAYRSGELEITSRIEAREHELKVRDGKDH
jgi:hypothetical protein